MAAGVGDAGGSRVADDGDARTRPERGGKLDGAARLVVHVVADSGGTDVEVVEQLLGLARVLAGDLVDRAQHTQRAQGDVFQVADGRGDEVEAGGERTLLLRKEFARRVVGVDQVFVEFRGLIRGHQASSMVGV